MTQRLLDTAAVPPGNNLDQYFRYTDPDTGYTVVARDHYSWIEQAKIHRRSNGLGIPIDFESRMESQLCEQLPPGWCQRAPDEGWVNTRFNWDDIKNGMRAFVGLIQAGKFVSQTEADRRAKICATCYLNQPVPGCTTCRKLGEFITGDIAKRSTPWDHKLQSCSVCRCVNAVQVHFPIEALDKADTPENQALFPASFCWKSKRSPNYIPNENPVPN